jgi:hypothetical protein
MLRFGALIAVAAFTATPALAQQMNAREARAFVVGKLFSYQCFEGTRGAGRIMDNGSVAGTIQFRGAGGTRYAMLPQNTIRVVGDRVCASVKGVPFEPCFNLIKTSASTFRGSVSGMGFAYCDFVRRDRPVVAAVEPRGGAPMDLHTNRAAAFPKPITGKDLPPVDEADEDAAAEDKPVQDRTVEARRDATADVKPAEETTGTAKPVDAKPADALAQPDEKPELRTTKD